MHGILTDVDSMMSIQQELERSRKKLEHIVNSIPGGIVLNELEGDKLKTYVYGDWIYCNGAGNSTQISGRFGKYVCL